MQQARDPKHYFKGFAQSPMFAIKSCNNFILNSYSASQEASTKFKDQVKIPFFLFFFLIRQD